MGGFGWVVVVVCYGQWWWCCADFGGLVDFGF